MRKIFCFSVFVLALGTFSATAQEAEHEIRQTMDRMFDGMMAGDADMVSSTFVDGAMLSSLSTREGTPHVERMSADQFVNAVRQGTGGWDERIWDVQTTIKSNLATGAGAHHSQAFNEVASLYWMRDGELNQRSSEAYIAGASGSPADNEFERVRYIEWVNVTGTAAVGKIVLDYPGVYIVDYMSLLKIDGQWQIVNKIFDVDSE